MEYSLQLAVQWLQSSIASSNSRMAYIHTTMYAVPFWTASLRAAFSLLEKPGACVVAAFAGVYVVPSSAAITHLSA